MKLKRQLETTTTSIRSTDEYAHSIEIPLGIKEEEEEVDVMLRPSPHSDVYITGTIGNRILRETQGVDFVATDVYILKEYLEERIPWKEIT